jgi:hypothetical protein
MASSSYMSGVSFNAPTDYATELAALERRRKLADLLQAQSMQPLESGMAGGLVVPTSPMQGFAKLAQALVANKTREAADEGQKDIAQRAQNDIATTMARALQAGRGTPARDAITLPEDVAGPTMGAQAEISPDPAASASMLMSNPLTQALGQQMWMKQQEPFTLAKDATRYGPGGSVVARGTPSMHPVTTVDASGNPVTQFVNPQQQAAPLPQPVKKEVAPTGQVYSPFTVQPGEITPDPNKPFAVTPQGVVPNQPYQNYEMNKANAGATRVQTNVNAFTPASEEAQRDFIKSTRATYDQLKQAPVMLQSIEQAKALVPTARGFMGPAGESLLGAAKFLNNRVGMSINTEGVKSAEELRTRIFFNIMDNLKKMDAQPTQMQQQIMAEALGNLGTDPNALPRVLDAFADVMRGKVAIHNQEVQGAIQRGVKFPYDPVIKLQTSSAQGVPAGVDPKLWAVMTPEEKTLWQK